MDLFNAATTLAVAKKVKPFQAAPDTLKEIGIPISNESFSNVFSKAKQNIISNDFLKNERKVIDPKTQNEVLLGNVRKLSGARGKDLLMNKWAKPINKPQIQPINKFFKNTKGRSILDVKINSNPVIKGLNVYRQKIDRSIYGQIFKNV